jgi:hypothetical protein
VGVKRRGENEKKENNNEKVEKVNTVIKLAGFEMERFSRAYFPVLHTFG